MLGRVDEGQERDRLVETDSLANGPSEAEIDSSDDQGDDSGPDEKSPEAWEEGPAEADIESEELDWEPETESLEVLDDPVRMYLGGIGRVRLLTFKDERVLARKLEGEKHLLALEKELTDQEVRSPRPWEITCALLH